MSCMWSLSIKGYDVVQESITFVGVLYMLRLAIVYRATLVRWCRSECDAVSPIPKMLFILWQMLESFIVTTTANGHIAVHLTNFTSLTSMSRMMGHPAYWLFLMVFQSCWKPFSHCVMCGNGSSPCASCRTMATTKNIHNLKIKTNVKAMKMVDEIGEYKNQLWKQCKKWTITSHSSGNVVHIVLRCGWLLLQINVWAIF